MLRNIGRGSRPCTQRIEHSFVLKLPPFMALDPPTFSLHVDLCLCEPCLKHPLPSKGSDVAWIQRGEGPCTTERDGNRVASRVVHVTSPTGMDRTGVWDAVSFSVPWLENERGWMRTPPFHPIGWPPVLRPYQPPATVEPPRIPTLLVKGDMASRCTNVSSECQGEMGHPSRVRMQGGVEGFHGASVRKTWMEVKEDARTVDGTQKKDRTIHPHVPGVQPSILGLDSVASPRGDRRTTARFDPRSKIPSSPLRLPRCFTTSISTAGPANESVLDRPFHDVCSSPAGVDFPALSTSLDPSATVSSTPIRHHPRCTSPSFRISPDRTQ